MLVISLVSSQIPPVDDLVPSVAAVILVIPPVVTVIAAVALIVPSIHFVVRVVYGSPEILIILLHSKVPAPPWPVSFEQDRGRVCLVYASYGRSLASSKYR